MQGIDRKDGVVLVTDRRPLQDIELSKRERKNRPGRKSTLEHLFVPGQFIWDLDDDDFAELIDLVEEERVNRLPKPQSWSTGRLWRD